MLCRSGTIPGKSVFWKLRAPKVPVPAYQAGFYASFYGRVLHVWLFVERGGRCFAIAFAIRTNKLRKVYGKDAEKRDMGLLGLSLEVEEGQVFGLVGPNGSGKTTTLKLLLGLIFPDSGEGEILGINIGELTHRERIGFLPEEPYYYDHLDAVELLRFYGGLFGMGGKVLESRIQELLELVGMWDRRKVRVRDYSRGMRQRVGVAQALVNDPDLVFMDEPTSGLDPLGAIQIRHVIETIRERGKTVFLCSHLLKEMEPLCDHVAILARGQLRALGSVDELLAEDQAYEVRALNVAEALQSQFETNGAKVMREGYEFSVIVGSQTEAIGVAGQMNDAGASLLFVGPRQRSLEEVFIEKVGE